MKPFLILFLVLWAGLAGAGQNRLDWTDNSNNEDSFRIERKLGPLASTSAFSEIAFTGPNIVTYTDSAVTDGTEYCYRVRARNVAGDSGYSNTACRLVPIAPPPPTNLRISRLPTMLAMMGPGAVYRDGAPLWIEYDEPVTTGLQHTTIYYWYTLPGQVTTVRRFVKPASSPTGGQPQGHMLVVRAPEELPAEPPVSVKVYIAVSATVDGVESLLIEQALELP